MRPTALALLVLPAAVACQEYDLYRPDKVEPEAEEPEPEPEPEPDPTEPDIELSRTEIDFSGYPKGCSSDWEEVVVSNVGGADLEVSMVELAGDGRSAFTLRSDVGEAFTLAPGESASVFVAFAPTAWVDYEPTLNVSSNDPDEALVEAQLSGFGAEDPFTEETFEQDLYDKVDVLWVVDNSCSMSDDLATVAANFNDFIQVFIDLGVDWQMGIVTTDMDNPLYQGRLVGPYLTPSTPNVVDTFINQIDLGSSGSADEQGFEATQAAIDTHGSGHNAGFERADAALSVIVLSDEDNSSFQSSASFISWFEALKPSDELTTFSAICENAFFSCTKYSEAANATGGIVGDIASASYSSVLNTISFASAGLTVNFDLAQVPSDLSRMAVDVDGVAVPNDFNNGWTYDSADNSITFRGSSVPDPGARGTISYPVAMECP